MHALGKDKAMQTGEACHPDRSGGVYPVKRVFLCLFLSAGNEHRRAAQEAESAQGDTARRRTAAATATVVAAVAAVVIAAARTARAVTLEVFGRDVAH